MTNKNYCEIIRDWTFHLTSSRNMSKYSTRNSISKTSEKESDLHGRLITNLNSVVIIEKKKKRKNSVVFLCASNWPSSMSMLLKEFRRHCAHILTHIQDSLTSQSAWGYKAHCPNLLTINSSKMNTRGERERVWMREKERGKNLDFIFLTSISSFWKGFICYPCNNFKI